jgi:hypothetical protein
MVEQRAEAVQAIAESCGLTFGSAVLMIADGPRTTDDQRFWVKVADLITQGLRRPPHAPGYQPRRQWRGWVELVRVSHPRGEMIALIADGAVDQNTDALDLVRRQCMRQMDPRNG